MKRRTSLGLKLNEMSDAFGGSFGPGLAGTDKWKKTKLNANSAEIMGMMNDVNTQK